MSDQDEGEFEELNAAFPKGKKASPSMMQAAPDDEFNDLNSSFPKGASIKAASADSTQPASAKQPGWGTALTYGISDALPFSHDIGAAIQAGETYLPKSLATDDIGDTASGTSLADRYRQQKARIDAIGKSVSRDYPVTSFAAPVVAGALALPVSGPVSGIAGGLGRVIPAMGAGARTALASGAVGAGYGGLYGAATGDTLQDRAHNAAVNAGLGGVFGAVAPKVADVIGSTANGVLSHFGFTNAENEAASAVRAAREPNAGLSSQDVQNAIDAGQPITVGDVMGGPKVQRLAEKAAVSSPEAEAAIKNVVIPRWEDNGPRAKAFIQNLFGSNLNPSDIIDNMRGQARIANKTNYDAAFSSPNAQSVWSPSLENLIQSPSVKTAIADTNRVSQEETVLERALARQNGQPVPTGPIVKNPFVDSQGTLTLPIDPKTGKPSVTPNLQFWDMVKRNLDSMHDSALDNFGKATNQSRLIDGLRKSLVSDLDNTVPEYKAARAGAAGFFGENDAFSAGLNYLSKKNALKSAQADKDLAALTPAQKDLFGQGVAADFAQKAENANTRSNALRQFNDPATGAKIRNALGPYADKVESFLRVEQQMDQMKGTIGGSPTAKRTMDQGPYGHGVVGVLAHGLGNPITGGIVGAGEAYRENGADPWAIAKGAGTGAALGWLARRGINHHEAVQGAIARLLMEGDPKKVVDVSNAIANKPTFMGALRNLNMNLTAPVTRASANRLPSSQQNGEPQPAYAAGGAVKRKTHEQLVSRLMSLSEKAKAATKRDTKSILHVDDNTVAKALNLAQKAI